MENSPNSKYARLTVFMGEQDRLEGGKGYRRLVEILHGLGVAGVTVLRGIEGYGADGQIHLQSILSLSMDLPIVVIAVDRRETLEKAIAVLRPNLTKGLVTLEPVPMALWPAQPEGPSGSGEDNPRSGRSREDESV